KVVNNVIDTNKVTVSGKIKEDLEFSHTVYGEGFYNTYIEIPRLSQVVDVLPVTISERLIQSLELKQGDHILVDGQLRSYNKTIDGKNRLILITFARELSLIESE